MNIADLFKAKPTKYLSREPKKSGKGYDYTYKDEGKPKKSWMESLMELFALKDISSTIKKVKKDYDDNNIKEKFGLSSMGWQAHLKEYFNNKSKWDLLLGKKAEKKDKKKTTDKKVTKKKAEKKAKKEGFKLSAMKFIHNLYGDVKKEDKKDNFETMPDKETPEQKKEDVKISKEINKVTPETRNKTEREILDIPEPPPEEDIARPKAEFKPIDTEIIIPFYPGDDNKFPAKDFMGVTSKDIFLVSDKNILTEAKPSYIPEIDEDFFGNLRHFLPTVKLEENKYVIQTHQKKRYGGFSQPEKSAGEDLFAIVTRDVLVATQDYYLKKKKAEKTKHYDDIDSKLGRKVKRKRVTLASEATMTYKQSNFMNSFTGERGNPWGEYQEIRRDMKQKAEDMAIQLEEYYNTHAKGKETAYGDVGLKNNLLDGYGIKVKRQNGAEINDTEINEIKFAMDDLFSVFGDRSSMAKNFGLKISHSGDKLMHARKAAGLFLPSMKAIGITAKSGPEGTGFILAHEWAHFMDYYVGEKEDKHYVSDDPTNVAGKIASTFRRNMTEVQKSVYQRRTCECFARAMEQYWAIKTNNEETLAEWNTGGNHPSDEVFKSEIYPLCEKFLKENEQMLKALRKFNLKFDSDSHKYIYSKVY